MQKTRWIKTLSMLATGMVVFQAGGCTTELVLSFLQTVALGVTAAASFVILQNV